MEFLKPDEVKTDSNIYSILNRIGQFEERAGKDVFCFDLNECAQLLMDIEPKSTKHVSTIKSALKGYVEWAVEKGYAKINYWPAVSTDAVFAQKAFKTRYVRSLEELETIVEFGINCFYDKYAIYLIWMGILGEEGMELRQIRDLDVDYVRDTIQIPRRLFTSIVPQIRKLMVKKTQAEYRGQGIRRNEDSPYFIKPFLTKDYGDKPIHYARIHQVPYNASKAWNDEHSDDKKNLTPRTVWKSGLYSALYKTEKEKGVLTIVDYEIISEIYGNTEGFSRVLPDYELYKSIFWADEIPIKNIMNEKHTENDSVETPEDILNLIRELARLKDEGIISRTEFSGKKRELLKRI